MPARPRPLITLSILFLVGAGSMARLWAADSRVADAAEHRDLQAIRTLIGQHADVNGPQPDGATAIQWAAHWDQLEMIDVLLKAGARVDMVNDNGVTALALACENGSAAAVDKLLHAGANVNVATASGETALMTAARTGNLDVVRALVSRGANVNAKESSHGQTALMWAVFYRHPSSVAALLEAGADVTARSEIRSRMVHTGNRFGDRGADKGALRMDLGGFTPLLFAAAEDDVESGRLLLAKGANVNETAPNGASVLAVAALSGHSALSMFLVEQGADVSMAGAGYTPLHAAIVRGDHALAKALLAHGANVDTRLTKGTPSRYYSKDYAFNEALIGATPFLLAARYGDVEMLRILAAAGADRKTSLPDGTTPLLAAVAANSGFGVGNRREQYLSPADVAAKVEGEDEKLTADTTEALLGLGADVNAANQNGDTPLHLAAGQGLPTVARVLTDKGANLEAKNKRGMTPLAAAIAPRPRGPFAPTGPDTRVPVAELLRKLGAQEPPPPAEGAGRPPR